MLRNILIALALAATTSSAIALETPTTNFRAALNTFSPTHYSALVQLEAKNGVRYTDDEIVAVTHSEEFKNLQQKLRSEFCSTPDGSKTMECQPQP